jgi:spermidine synthase
MIKTNHFHETRALRTIEAGEQVFISYNRCSGCGGRVEEGYSTAEMLRDYGFVEPFPQSWHFYNFREVEFELHHDEEAGYYEVEWKRQPDEYRAAMIQDWLRAQILRLNRLWHVTYRNRHDHEANGMPQNEWDMIWTFQKANLVAMRCALNALNGNTRTLVASTEAEVSVDDLYHNFQENAWESVDLELPQCNTEDFDHYMSIDSATSYLQTLNFSVLRLHQLDICMDRDSHIHVCSSFRPSYFEYFVHPAASLIKSVRRVLVMGSGASFLVHEVMKYSSTLELVVAIEPDQAVTRKSYQHFHVDPHFDDSRVEWWFGDFGESLSLMPVEYWNSFDLVLLDMAKYNYPFVFTDGKRFTDLVHKEGIMVSHDNHIRELSESFAFTSRLVYHLTPHCTQILTLGSHSVDLLYAPSHDHDIETLIYEPSLMKDHRRELIHDYISHSIESSDSNNIKAEEYTSSTDAIGVIQIVDVVNARTKNLDETMKVIEDEVTQRGFQVLSKFQLPTSDSVFVIMQEGYVVARVDAPNQYIGLDIFLSRKVTKRALLQSAIVDKLGATISSFRFVTNGMEVPVLNSSRSERSESVAIPSPGPLDVSIIESFLAESFQTFFDSPKHVLVICESPTDCPSHNWVVDLKVAESVHQLVMCSDLQNQEDDSEESLVDSVIACEHEIQEWIETTIISNEIFVEAIFLDGGLSHHSLQILDAVVNVRQESRQSWIPEETLLVTLPTKDNKSQGRQSFGDRYHEVGTKWSDSTKVEFLVLDRDDSPLMEFGIISQGIENTLDEIEAFETSLTSKLNKLEKKVKIRQLRGQPLETSDILPARRFGHHQYDEPVEASGSTIRNGVQTFFQVDFMQEETSSMLTMDMLSTFVVDTLEAIGATTIQKHLSDNKTLRVFEFDSGHAIVALYPAKNTMEFNFFCQCKDEMENCVQDNLFMFVNTLFLQSSELGLYALDMFPRGPGKVLNFAQSQGDDDDDDDEYYEEEE